MGEWYIFGIGFCAGIVFTIIIERIIYEFL